MLIKHTTHFQWLFDTEEYTEYLLQGGLYIRGMNEDSRVKRVKEMLVECIVYILRHGNTTWPVTHFMKLHCWAISFVCPTKKVLMNIVSLTKKVLMKSEVDVKTLCFLFVQSISSTFHGTVNQ